MTDRAERDAAGSVAAVYSDATRARVAAEARDWLCWLRGVQRVDPVHNPSGDILQSVDNE
jgi:hypothetical protein